VVQWDLKFWGFTFRHTQNSAGICRYWILIRMDFPTVDWRGAGYWWCRFWFKPSIPMVKPPCCQNCFGRDSLTSRVKNRFGNTGLGSHLDSVHVRIGVGVKTGQFWFDSNLEHWKHPMWIWRKIGGSDSPAQRNSRREFQKRIETNNASPRPSSTCVLISLDVLMIL